MGVAKGTEKKRTETLLGDFDRLSAGRFFFSLLHARPRPLLPLSSGFFWIGTFLRNSGRAGRFEINKRQPRRRKAHARARALVPFFFFFLRKASFPRPSPAATGARRRRRRRLRACERGPGSLLHSTPL